MEGSPVGNFVIQALMVLFLAGVLAITLRTLFIVSMLTWSPLATLWRRLRDRLGARANQRDDF